MNAGFAPGGERSAHDGHAREYGAWLGEHADFLVPGCVAIDAGCGVGDDSAELVAAGLCIVGIDLSPARLALAARRAPAASYVCGDLRRGLPFRGGAADLVVASLSLHYYDRRTTDALVRDVRRVLRPDGTLLCRVNVVGDTASRYGEGTELEPDFFETQPGRFKRFFSEASLRAILSPHLDVESIVRRETLVQGQHVKQTLVARARRRG
jgi:SAM-dependent methyltransferase